MKNGYWQKMLRVYLTNGKNRVQEIPQEELRNSIGGAGLGAEILRRELP
jgi:aldehyde:ferredoxin oxidoreductase